ncbi:MAG: adenosylmethionine--8-amino-7-oxononanoate transaminase [Kiritimatiellae bacterium]|nr:adenosylmethionine--8-amino-7-oxononanoate transaminase [Kiritimatiellia bacterium]
MTDIATLLSQDFHAIWHPYTRFSTLREHQLPVLCRGEGMHLYTPDGRAFVDAISSWWCCALGHSHPAIVRAIQSQAGQLQHSILGNLTHPQAIRLAHRLAHLLPTRDRHTLFASDGSSAIEQAVKIAVQYRHNTGETQRRKIACLTSAYHGDTLGSMSLGYVEAFHRPFRELLFSAVRLPFPQCPCRMTRDIAPGHSEPDPACTASCFAEAEAILEEVAEELTAVVVEPMVQGAAGMRMHGAGWLSSLATWCRNHDVLLILDEIATGFGRTGELFAFHHAAGVDPDILCLGKALTAGSLPLSATVVKDFVYRTFADLDEDHTLQHGHTFCGNPIAAAAANAALDVYLAPEFLTGVRELAGLLRTGLEPCREIPGVRDVRCLGLVGAVELEPHHGRPADSRAHQIRRHLQDQGILLRPIGDVLYLMPPLIIDQTTLDWLIREFIQAISTVAR